MILMNARFLPAGDTALIVEFGNRVDRELSDRVLRLSAVVRASKIPGIVETVPTYRSLMVLYDPLVIDGATLIASIEKLVDRNAAEKPPARAWRIPACYEMEHAPDLAEVAERTGRSAEEIVNLHGHRFSCLYDWVRARTSLYGRSSGLMALPRRSDPRVRAGRFGCHRWKYERHLFDGKSWGWQSDRRDSNTPIQCEIA
jgi:allophanate hydrolase subunit 1